MRLAARMLPGAQFGDTMIHDFVSFATALRQMQDAGGYVQIAGHSASTEEELRAVYGRLGWDLEDTITADGPAPNLIAWQADLQEREDSIAKQLAEIDADRQKLGEMKKEIEATLEAIIPTSERALQAATIEQLTAVAQYRKIDPIPTTKDALVAALKPAAPAPKTDPES